MRSFFNTPCQATNFCPPGNRAEIIRPGDFILVHGTGVGSWLIRFGQKLRFNNLLNKQFAYWNHAAMIILADGTLIESDISGVKQVNLSKYDQRSYTVVYIEASDEDRVEEVKFAQASLGQRYGWSQVVSIGLSMLTGLKFSFGFDDEMVCSGLVAKCLERTNAIFSRNSSNISPADLAKYYNVLSPRAAQAGWKVTPAYQNTL